MPALKPSINLSGKRNVIPSIDRITEATAEDFKEISLILTDHANLINGINRVDEQSLFYGFFTTLDLLKAEFPVAEEDGFAVIDPRNGNPQKIATYNLGVWTAEEVKAPIKFYLTKAGRPDVGEEGVWYIVKDEKIAYLWYDGKYNGFGKDGSNGLSAYQIAQVVLQFAGTEEEWLASLVGKDNYALWLDAGNVGNYADFFEASRGPQGIPGPVGPAGVDKWKGSFLTEAALITQYPEGADQVWHNNEGGWTADVDAGANAKVVRYIWDSSDLSWEMQSGESTAETAASIRTKYLSNLGTEEFTTTLKNKLDSITAIFTTALKASYDIASTWVSTNGQNVLDHLAKWVVPSSTGKVPVSQSDGSIVWEAKTPNNFLGYYTTLANLQAAHPSAFIGAHADVDAGVGADVKRYVWDNDDNKWVTGGTGGTVDTSNLAKLDQQNTFAQKQTFVKLNVEDLAVSNPRTTRFTQFAGSTAAGWYSKMLFGIISNGVSTDMLELEGGNNSFGVSKIRLKAGNIYMTGNLDVAGNLTGIPQITLNRNSHEGYALGNFGKISGYLRTEGASNPQFLTLEAHMSGGTGWLTGIRFKLKDGGGVEGVPLELRANGYGDFYIQANSRIILGSAGIDLSNLIEAADDAAAGAAGVAVGRGYINSATGALHKRRT